MGYRSDVSIVLTKSHFEELLGGFKEKAKEDDAFKCNLDLFKYTKTLTTPDESYVLIEISSVKWDETWSAPIGFIDDFLEAHRHSFIRIGESSSDVEENNLTEDEWGYDEEFDYFLYTATVTDYGFVA